MVSSYGLAPLHSVVVAAACRFARPFQPRRWVWLGLLLSSVAWETAVGQESAGGKAPNIIVVIVDDMG